MPLVRRRRLCCCRRWINFSHFHLPLEPLDQFQPNLAQNSLGEGIQVCSNEGPGPFPREDNSKFAKIHWQILKIFFSRTDGPISTKLGRNHLWVKGIQFYSNEGLLHFPSEDNYKITKILWKFFKIFFSRTPGPISQWKLGTKYSWV